MVTTVVEDSPADVAGIKTGDFINTVEGQVMNWDKLVSHVGTKKCGDIIRLKITHGQASRNVDVTLGSRPDDDTSTIAYELDLLGGH